MADAYDFLLEGIPEKTKKKRKSSVTKTKDTTFDFILDGTREPEFHQRSIRLGDIKGFRGQPRTDSFWENVGLEVGELMDSYGELAKMLYKDFGGTAKLIAENFDDAIVESYTRWYDAAKSGNFVEAIEKYPVQFAQDMLAPLSLGLGTTSGVLGMMGKLSTKAQRNLRTANRIMDVADFAVDPVIGTMVYGAKKGTGAIVNKARRFSLSNDVANAVNNPRTESRFNVDYGDANTGSILERWDKLKTQAMTSVVDANYPILKLASRVEAIRNNMPLNKAHHFRDTAVSDALRIISSSEKKAEYFLKHGFSDPNFAGRPLDRSNSRNITGETKGLFQIGEDVGRANILDLDDYSLSKRAIELDSNDIESGFPLEETGAMLNEFDPLRNPDTDPVIDLSHKDVLQFNDDSLTYYQQGGMLSLDTANKFRAKHKNYVPFYRNDKIRMNIDGKVMDVRVDKRGDIKGIFNTNGSRVKNPKQFMKKIKGSLRGIKSPLEMSAIQATRMVREVELNKVMKEISAFADVEGSGVRWVEAPEGVSSKVTMDELEKMMEMQGVFDDIAEGRDPVVRINSPIMRPGGIPDEVAVVFIDGERKFLEFDDPAVAESLAALRMNPQGEFQNWFTKWSLGIAKKPAALLRAGVTGEPGFMGTNLVRDTVGATFYSNYNFVPILDNIRGLYHFLKKTPVFEAWNDAGGLASHISAIDVPSVQRGIRDYLRPENQKYLERVKDKVVSPYEWMQKFQEAVEASTRLGEFNKGMNKELGRKSGESVQEAMERARLDGVNVEQRMRRAATSSRDISTDFAISGGSDAIKAMRAIVPFFGAAINGTDLLRKRLFTGSPKERAAFALKASLMLGVPSAYLATQNVRDPEYADIPTVEKDLFWHARIGETLYRIPKPFDIGMLYGSLPQRTVEAWIEDDPSIATDMVGRFGASLMPAFAPTILKAPLEIATDWDFFYKAPLTPRSQKRFIKSEQYTPSTSQFARAMSKFSEWASGGKEAMMSPIEIDKLIIGTTGTLGRAALTVTNPAIGTIRGEPQNAPAPKGGMASRIPLYNRFLANPSKSSQARTDWYDEFERLRQVRATAKRPELLDRRDFVQGRVNELMKERLYNQTYKRIVKLTKLQRTIAADGKMNGLEKRKRMNKLDRLINKLIVQTQQASLKRFGEK